MAGLYGNFGQTNYSAAKPAVVGFMNSLKLEGSRYGILVNAIAPLALTRMGAIVFPASLSTTLRPELVAPVVAYLCSEQCTQSGDIIAAGGGSFTRVQMIESKGVRFDPNDHVTPEMIAQRFSDIADMSGAAAFSSAKESISAAVETTSSYERRAGQP